MATASPTPMGSSHFASLSRKPSSSRLPYRQLPARTQHARAEPYVPESAARHYSLNDSSDDEIPLPMKFSALTKALLNDEASIVEQSPVKPIAHNSEVEVAHVRSGSLDSLVAPRDQITSPPPESKVHSPHPTKRIVRLSGASSLRRTSSLSKVQRDSEQRDAAREGTPLLDLSTPAHIPRTIRISTTTSSGNHGRSAGSSGRNSNRTDSASRNEEVESQEHPATVARSHLATSQGSVSRYGASTIGRNRYGEDAVLASSMRVKRVGKVSGMLLSGPARRGRRRLDDEEQSPAEEHGDGLDSAGASQQPQSQESQPQESQEREYPSSQEPGSNRASMYSSYRDFASGSPIVSRESKALLSSVLRSKSPPPPTLSGSRGSSASKSGSPRSSFQASAVSQPIQPVFKIPPRPDLPSAHDQENEAPPTFKRNKQPPLIHTDAKEKVPIRPESMDLDALRARTPERRPLGPRSQNTPRRPAPPPPKMSILDAATSTAGAATTSHASGKRNRLKLNGKHFTRLDCIGRGGSSRVYRVMAENSKFFALKRVSLDDADETAVRGFKGEIDLLRKLEGVDRVIRLYDYELNEEKGTLSVLMEMGELDMNKMLELRLKSDQAKFDPSFVRHYWKEMLECLQAIHEHDIVHSDLKPHNFVLCQGTLKLIDFGIANAIQTDETVNVHRDTQIGTPNYMSPESLMDSNAKPDSRGRINNEVKLMKLGKPSDIWSLGCILYQMVYGRAPFAHIPNQMHRCQAIINWNYEIEYPNLGVGNVPVPWALIKTLKKCLNRDQHLRPSATELLSERDPFLHPVEFSEDAFPMTEELLGRILQNVATKCGNKIPTDAELLVAWPKGYLNNLRQKLKDGRPL
ncbi:kinase-like domain-containing protein [Bisporella sp. PMI_857]|nr:kinase-like domain-containing protein [Bisporella sp. PMI_857]